MSIQTEIDRIISAVHAAHEKVAEKGGTTAEPYLVANLESAIESIPEASDPVLQSKTVSPSTSSQTVKPDTGYDGLSQVTVNAMPTATQATPSISVSSAGLITASATQSAGYVNAGTKSATKQLTVQAAKTVTPTTSEQTAVASGRYTTGDIKVGAIPSSYVQPSGTKTITENGTYDVKNYASATVNVESSGEDLTTEIEDYTSKLATLDTAITALEQELEGKASGGGTTVKTCTITFAGASLEVISITYTNSNLELVTDIVNINATPSRIVATNTILYSNATIDSIEPEPEVTGASETIGSNAVLVKSDAYIYYY